jgi:FkbH-like protein
MSNDELKTELKACLKRMEKSIDLVLKCNRSAVIFIYGYAVSYRPALGSFEYKSNAYTALDLQIDYQRGLYELGFRYASVYVYDHLINNAIFSDTNFVKTHTADGIYEHLTAECYKDTVGYFKRLLNLALSKTKRVKCIVCDLDNTLWRGILRDSGKAGIEVNFAVLNILKLLSRRGVIIALCSKNDESVEAELESILGNEFMRLVSAMRINWLPKSQNIKALAGILNIGLDSMAFVDDNQYEREQVISSLPEVRVFKETEFYSMLTDMSFEPEGAVTLEASVRAEMYREQARRNDAEQSFDGGFDEFLRDCQMKVYMNLVSKNELDRVAELIQRTNQLNTSTKRYTKSEVIEMHGNEKFLLYTLRVKDRFGDYGLVGVVVVQIEQKEWFISLLLLSCRVMGRNIESFMFDFVKERAKKSGANLITLEFNPTDRNQAMQKIVTDNGFEKREIGRYLYQLKENEEIIVPDYLTVSKV